MAKSKRWKRSITADPRWHDFVVKYRDEFEKFAEEACLEIPTHQQVEVFEAVQVQGSRTSVSSGTGTGKSSGTGIMLLCFLLTYPNARVCVTANKVGQVMIGVMKNVAKYWKEIKRTHPWLQEYFTLTDTAFYCNEAKLEWSLGVKGYRVGQEESLAGEHARHLLYIVDEASGVGDPAFEKITGTLTEEDNRLLLLSQPTRNDGLFYRSHHELKLDPANPVMGAYTCITLNSEQSPLVTSEYLASKYNEYGGRESAEYKIRVRGLFADTSEGMLISRVLAEEGFNSKIEHEEDWGYVAVCDVGGGNYRDSCVLTIGRVSGFGETRVVEVIQCVELGGNVGAVDFARILIAEYLPYYQNLTIGVDAGAMGGEMIKELHRHNVPNVYPINWGGKMHAKSKKSRYFNKRAYACAMVRDALRFGNIRLLAADKKFKEKLIGQFSKIPFEWVDSGDGLQLQIWPKPKMKSEGIKSPDIFDTHAFFWMVDYIPVSNESEEEEDYQIATSGEGDELTDDELMAY